jgi:hypothetical protein
VIHICVNPIDLFLIWSEISNLNKKGYIYKTRYDGSSKISLMNHIIVGPTSMEVDYTIKRIYVIDQTLGHFVSIDYNGNNMKLIYSSHRPFLFPLKIYLYNGFIYWSYSSMILKIRLYYRRMSTI